MTWLPGPYCFTASDSSSVFMLGLTSSDCSIVEGFNGPHVICRNGTGTAQVKILSPSLLPCTLPATPTTFKRCVDMLLGLVYLQDKYAWILLVMLTCI